MTDVDELYKGITLMFILFVVLGSFVVLYFIVLFEQVGDALEETENLGCDELLIIILDLDKRYNEPMQNVATNKYEKECANHIGGLD